MLGFAKGPQQKSYKIGHGHMMAHLRTTSLNNGSSGPSCHKLRTIYVFTSSFFSRPTKYEHANGSTSEQHLRTMDRVINLFLVSMASLNSGFYVANMQFSLL